MKTLGEKLVETLENYGIDIVFGIPGNHTIELYRGLETTNIRHVTPRHEQGAGFMADGYARVTGRPAACFVITGPGMTNILTAMAQALADSVPMLVISAVSRTYDLGHGEGHLHELPNQQQTISGACRFSHRLVNATDLQKVMARAFSVFNGARPGPVHIEIPVDIITADASSVSTRAYPKVYRPAPNPAGIAAAVELLAQAKNPMVVLGGGAKDYRVEASRLVDRLGAKVALTVNAKGVLPSSHPLSLGARLPQAAVRQALEEADVVLAIGTELGETDTLLFDGTLRLEGKVIRVDIDAAQLVSNALPEVGICSDAGLAMDAMYRALAAAKPFDARAEVAELIESSAQAFPPAYADHGRILREIANKLPGLIIAGDSAQPVYGGSVFFDPDAPRSFFISATGYGTLGYALPAAIGAKLGQKDKPVLALVGDGGFQFSIGELAVLAEENLAVIVLIWNNRGYREIKYSMVKHGLPTIGVDISGPDLEHIAKAYGCHYIRVENRSDLSVAIDEVANCNRPVIFEIVEDKIHLASDIATAETRQLLHEGEFSA